LRLEIRRKSDAYGKADHRRNTANGETLGATDVEAPQRRADYRSDQGCEWNSGECYRVAIGRFGGNSRSLIPTLAPFRNYGHVGAFVRCAERYFHRRGKAPSTSLDLRKDCDMNQNSKNWLALNASGLTWLVLTLGIMAFAGMLVAWSLQPHAVQ
jgi:hypothetical protein